MSYAHILCAIVLIIHHSTEDTGQYANCWVAKKNDHKSDRSVGCLRIIAGRETFLRRLAATEGHKSFFRRQNWFYL